MQRVPPIDPAVVDPRTMAVFEAQEERWGAPLVNHLMYARRPSIFKGVRGMWAGLDQSGLLPPLMHSALNRRVAALIGCDF
ncbi:MAG: hypothetical protein ACR2P0_07515 [Acidimicrobiales bacterium]